MAWGVCNVCFSDSRKLLSFTHLLCPPASTARLPLSLHLALAQDAPGLPARQPRVGVPKVSDVVSVSFSSCSLVVQQCLKSPSPPPPPPPLIPSKTGMAGKEHPWTCAPMRLMHVM